MSEKLLKSLPWIAFISGVLTVGFLIILLILNPGMKKENNENRDKALAVIDNMQGMHLESIKDPALKLKAQEALSSQYIATIWLISSEGEIIFSQGSTAGSSSKGSVTELATLETQEILKSLPSDSLPQSKRILILAASAIQREGTHNDIYNHLIREIHSIDGSTLGLIGMAYELNSDGKFGSLGKALGVLVVILGFLVYWISLPLWVYLDGRQRGERVCLWVLFLFVGNLVALVAYLFARLPLENSRNGLK